MFLFVAFQVKAMVEGRDRRAELGYKLALEIRKREENPELYNLPPPADQTIESCNA